MKKNQVVDTYRRVKSSLNLGVRHGCIYEKEGKNWKKLPELDLPIRIRKLFDATANECISTNDVKEVIERITQDPDLQLQFADETEERYVSIANGIFDADIGKMITDDKLNFSYVLNFNYVSSEKRDTPCFDRFLQTSFPNNWIQKKKLLCQILGYNISDYSVAKMGFFLIGESNSGKSVLLELLKRIMPEQSVTAIPLYRLENRFNMAKLADSRLNISTEISEKSFAAADMFKILTSNETVTAEHKGKKPFEFRIRCKTINAGNVLPDLENIDGMDAILNRMTLLIFPVSIPKEKQDMQLIDNLWKERNSIFSEALDELHLLMKNKFVFEEPEDSKKVKLQMRAKGSCIQDFIDDCCIREKEAKVYFCTLYEAFQEYCEENLLDIKITKTQFNQRISLMPGMSREKLRIKSEGNKPLWGVRGIRLKRAEEYKGQDSDWYSQDNSRSEKSWNNGTVEREVQA